MILHYGTYCGDESPDNCDETVFINGDKYRTSFREEVVDDWYQKQSEESSYYNGETINFFVFDDDANKLDSFHATIRVTVDYHIF